MKKTSIILILLVLCVTSIKAQKTYALLTGVSNYRDEQNNLYNTTKDVKELKKVLEHQNAIATVVTSKYANHENIKKKLNAIVKLAQPNDKIIFFFSGHGNAGGFITSDHTMFRYQELVDILKKAKAQNIVILIDACMSGSAKSIASNNFGVGSNYPNIAFVASSDDSELSGENNWVGNGFFTKALLKGLRGKSDRDTDKQVTLIELFSYVYNDVTARTKGQKYEQHPQLICPQSMHKIVLMRW